ncbi:helix-turn-helix domain-containing protein [Alkanindiges illinoisensis]|uniref:helix-turn-helix domain-containing protein n=1 Tax=Alkanindiges illinoisensis TaxID=197183 RepID=UPI00047DB338|nr:helix-turn-helix transcriptional regulator [Alkanindiges illinoisensis]
MKTIYQQRYQKLIDNLITARKQANLTQSEIAQRLGKPQSYIAKIEGKDRKLDVLEFIELCEVLQIEASVLIKKLEKIYH